MDNFDDYTKAMRDPTAWGGYLEIHELAKINKKCIITYVVDDKGRELEPCAFNKEAIGSGLGVMVLHKDHWQAMTGKCPKEEIDNRQVVCMWWHVVSILYVYCMHVQARHLGFALPFDRWRVFFHPRAWRRR